MSKEKPKLALHRNASILYQHRETFDAIVEFLGWLEARKGIKLGEYEQMHSSGNKSFQPIESEPIDLVFEFLDVSSADLLPELASLMQLIESK